LNFVAVILKVLLVNLLAALNFANVFLKIKNVWKIKNVKKRKNVTKIKKTFFCIYDLNCGKQNPQKIFYSLFCVGRQCWPVCCGLKPADWDTGASAYGQGGEWHIGESEKDAPPLKNILSAA